MNDALKSRIEDVFTDKLDRLENIKAIKGEAFTLGVTFCISVFSIQHGLTAILSTQQLSEGVPDVINYMMPKALYDLVGRHFDALGIEDIEQRKEIISMGMDIVESTNLHLMQTLS